MQFPTQIVLEGCQYVIFWEKHLEPQPMPSTTYLMEICPVRFVYWLTNPCFQRCTIAEAHRQMQVNTWSISLEELDAFIAVLYARGAFGAKGQSVKTLWSDVWGPPLINETMWRNRFSDILRYLRFDLKATRSQRLLGDKFALVCEVCNRFIANSITCYKAEGCPLD